MCRDIIEYLLLTGAFTEIAPHGKIPVSAGANKKKQIYAILKYLKWSIVVFMDICQHDKVMCLFWSEQKQIWYNWYSIEIEW